MAESDLVFSAYYEYPPSSLQFRSPKSTYHRWLVGRGHQVIWSSLYLYLFTILFITFWNSVSSSLKFEPERYHLPFHIDLQRKRIVGLVGTICFDFSFSSNVSRSHCLTWNLSSRYDFPSSYWLIVEENCWTCSYNMFRFLDWS